MSFLFVTSNLFVLMYINLHSLLPYRDKANQDAYIAGARVSGKKSKSKLFKKERDNGVLFAGKLFHDCYCSFTIDLTHANIPSSSLLSLLLLSYT